MIQIRAQDLRAIRLAFRNKSTIPLERTSLTKTLLGIDGPINFRNRIGSAGQELKIIRNCGSRVTKTQPTIKDQRLKGCSHETSKSLTHEIDLDGSSQWQVRTRWRRKTLTDIVYIVTICHACMPVCRQCQHVYVMLQENLLV